jgi:hypothetical protein
MSYQKKCSECGAALRLDAPKKLCPKCLLVAAVKWNVQNQTDPAQDTESGNFGERGAGASPESRTLLGELLLHQEKFCEAEAVLRTALQDLERDLPGLSPTFLAGSLLGGALAGQERFAEAEPLLIQGYEGLKQRNSKKRSPAHSELEAEAGERLIQLYRAWNKPGAMAEWQAKLR